MEIAIFTALIIVIVLLAKDKVILQKKVVQKRNKKKKNAKLKPSILGKTKTIKRKLTPLKDTESQDAELAEKRSNLDHVTAEKGTSDVQSKQKSQPNYEEEEEEWQATSSPGIEEGFTPGVTQRELETAQQVIDKGLSDPGLVKIAVDVVQKVQGTELYSLLERAISDASTKIAAMLDKDIDSDSARGSAVSDPGDFDVREFV